MQADKQLQPKLKIKVNYWSGWGYYMMFDLIKIAVAKSFPMYEVTGEQISGESGVLDVFLITERDEVLQIWSKNKGDGKINSDSVQKLIHRLN